ncbi:MAG: insulinase family protein [Deltaproteobacteria bacterium]|nr:insulinase family protein [Deltaproteobacteria bacterium]
MRSIPLGRHEILHETLENGLEVLILADQTSPVSALHHWFKVGSRNEHEGKTGLAHLFEHLMFGETENLRRGEFDRRIEAVGASMNAATWLDWTYYHETFLPEHLAMMAELEAERMARLVLGDEQVAREKDVVANERRFRVDNSVEGTANELLWKDAFRVHPYHHPTIGWMDDILGFSVEDCRRFYRTYYAPNNCCVVVAGPVEAREALEVVRRTHAFMAPQPIPADPVPAEPEQDGERRQRLSWPTPTPKTCVAWRSPDIAHPDHAALTVLSQVLLGGRSGRLQRRLVHDGELAADVSGGPGSFRDPSLLEIWADLREGRTHEEALAAIDDEVLAVAGAPPRPEELETARNQVLLAFRSALETAAGRAERIGFYHVTAGDAGAIDRRQRDLLAVSADAVSAAARKYLVPRTRNVLLVDAAEASP